MMGWGKPWDKVVGVRGVTQATAWLVEVGGGEHG